MHLKEILNEAPFTDKQEERFLNALRQDVKKRGEWPPESKIGQMVRKVSPPARKVGSGMFSDVYGRNRSSVVIKLTNEEDPMALKFLRYAKKHNNPHLPKVFSLQKVITKEQDYTGELVPTINFYARMERLNKLVPKKYPWKPEHYPFLVWMRRRGHLEQAWRVDDYIPNWEEIRITGKDIKATKLTRTLDTLARLRGKGEGLDIAIGPSGGHNIMVRPGTNELVIHDPFA